MILPAVLILLGTGAAVVFACGTNANLAEHWHGLRLIMLARQLQWPFVAVSLILSIALLGLVISGKRSAWWLIGLAPILGLFIHRFAPPARSFGVLESPLFVDARSPAAPRDDEWVVGVIFEKEPYAFPYRALYVRPLVLVTDYDKRMLVMWSAEANRAAAWSVSHEFRPRELEIVSRPMGALLVLNRRYGQFISSITGQTIDGQKPVAFLSAIATERTTWSSWRARHPQCRVMAIPEAGRDAPTGPIIANSDRVAVLATTQPAALHAQPADSPLNLLAGETRVLVIHDSKTGRLRAFDRRVSEDLFPSFRAQQQPKNPQILLQDSDTASLWTVDGLALQGDLKGHRLREIDVEEAVGWRAMKFWYPQLQLMNP